MARVIITNPVENISLIEGASINLVSEVHIDSSDVSSVQFRNGSTVLKTVTEPDRDYVFREIVQSGLLAGFGFEDNLNDFSGNGVTPHIVNSEDALYEDRDDGGKIISLGNHANHSLRSHLVIPTSSELASLTKLTICFWIQSKSMMGGGILQSAPYETKASIDILALSNGRIDFYLDGFNHGNDYRLRSVASHNTDSLTHFCWTYDGSTLTCYVNGLLDSSIAAEGINIATDDDWNLGIVGTNRYGANFDDFRIYNRALSAQELQVIVAGIQKKEFSYEWENVPAGNNSIVARATLVDSSILNSDPVVVTGLREIEVNIVSPADFQEFEEGDNIPIQVSVSESVKEVRLYRDGAHLATIPSSPYNYTWQQAFPGHDADSLIHFRFDGDLVDFSGNGNNGIFQNVLNASFGDGIKNGAVHLGGYHNSLLRSFILVPSSEVMRQVSGSFTVAFWFRADPTGYHVLFSSETPGSRGIFINTGSSDGRLDIILNSQISENTYRLRSSLSSADGTFNNTDFTHFCWMYDGETLRCLTNGIETNSAVFLGVDVQSDADWHINSSLRDIRGEGAYDDFRFYDHLITEAKLQEIIADDPNDVVTITAVAENMLGFEFSAAPVSINIRKPNQPPVVIVGLPFEGQVFEEGERCMITVRAGDPDGTLAEVVAYDGETLIGELTEEPYGVFYENVPLGTRHLTVRATDATGLETVKSVTINVGLKNMTPRIVKRLAISGIIEDAGLDYNDDPTRPKMAMDDVIRLRQTASGMQQEHIRLETALSRVPGRVSYRHEVDIFHPIFYANGESLTFRSEQYTMYNRLENERELWVSFSFYQDAAQIPDPDGETIHQIHATGFEPQPVLQAIIEMGMLYFQVRWFTSGEQNGMAFCLGEVPVERWHDVVYHVNLSEDIGKGSLKVWLNGKQARLHHPVSGSPWVNPTVQAFGEYKHIFAALETKGVLPQTIVEGGVECSLMVWQGKTCVPLPTYAPAAKKFGLYKWQWNYIDHEDPLSSGSTTVNRVLYMANINFAFGWNRGNKIFHMLDPDGLPAIDGINYDDPIPAALIVYPLNGSTLKPHTNVDIQVHIPSDSDPIDKIDLYIDDSLVRTSGDRDFTHGWNTGEIGTRKLHTITYYTEQGFIEADPTIVTIGETGEVIESPEGLVVVGNISPIIVKAIPQIVHPIIIKLAGVVVLEEEYLPDGNGDITIQLKDFLEDQVSLDMPDSDVFDQVNAVKDVECLIGSTAVSFRIVKGGVDKEDLNSSEFLASNWLTWQPKEKIVKREDPEWLSYYAQEEVAVRTMVVFDDDSSQTDTLATIPTGKLYTINVNFDYIQSFYPGTSLKSFEVWVEKTGVELTWRQSYVLSKEDFLYDDVFVFENSVGGIDTIRFTGEKEQLNKWKFDAAIFFDDIALDFDVTPDKAFRKNTGYFISKDQLTWSQDFFNSLRKFIVEESSLKRILVKDPEFTDVKHQLVELDFIFIYTKPTGYLYLER